MKKKVLTILFTAVILLGLGSGLGLIGASAKTGQFQGTGGNETANLLNNRTITVTGYGDARIQPDQAVVQVGVQTDADTAQDALAENSAQTDALVQALQDAGIAEEDISTLFVQLYPRYGEPAEPGGQPQIIGYTAITIVEIRVRDLNNLGSVLDTAVGSGANIIQSIRFEASDLSGSLDEARQEALNNARSSAEQLAALVDAQLGPVVNITEYSPGPFPFYGAGAAGAASVGAQAGAGGVVGQAQPAQVEPGAQTYYVTLQVTWSLVPNP